MDSSKHCSRYSLPLLHQLWNSEHRQWCPAKQPCQRQLSDQQGLLWELIPSQTLSPARHFLPQELLSCQEQPSWLYSSTVKICTLITLSRFCHLQHFYTCHHVCWLGFVAGSSKHANELQDSMETGKVTRLKGWLGHDFPSNSPTFHCCGTFSVPLAMLSRLESSRQEF